MTYLLDTNACIGVIKGEPASVRARFEAAVGDGDDVFVSSIVAFELWYGVAKSSRTEMNKQRLSSFFTASMQIVPFDEEDAKVAGEQRAVLESVGRLIGAYDLLIAGQALRRDWTLVTANVAEFSRIKGLRWQDWSKPGK